MVTSNTRWPEHFLRFMAGQQDHDLSFNTTLIPTGVVVFDRMIHKPF